MDLSALQCPPLTDAPAFKRLIRRIFAREFEMPQLVGRSGQAQHGADIVGRRSDGNYVVIQCRLNDSLGKDPSFPTGKFRAEVLTAREKFKPGLTHFILATTAAIPPQRRDMPTS